MNDWGANSGQSWFWLPCRIYTSWSSFLWVMLLNFSVFVWQSNACMPVSQGFEGKGSPVKDASKISKSANHVFRGERARKACQNRTWYFHLILLNQLQFIKNIQSLWDYARMRLESNQKLHTRNLVQKVLQNYIGKSYSYIFIILVGLLHRLLKFIFSHQVEKNLFFAPCRTDTWPQPRMVEVLKTKFPTFRPK